jgi:S1-C subfamily serine protease
VTLVLLFYFLTFPLSPEKIYEQAIECIVEIKAMTGENATSYGSAVIVSNDGELITNAHVVTYSKLSMIIEFISYSIRFSFEEYYREVELIKYDTELDLAVLKLKELPSFELKSLKKADSDKVKSGQNVYAVGNAQNHGIGITQGCISIPLLKINYQERIIDVIKCDLTITEGNSGGALLNERGKLIGITTFRLKDNDVNVVQGVAYCIPSNIAYTYLLD